jgi:hypothetical protein
MLQMCAVALQGVAVSPLPKASAFSYTFGLISKSRAALEMNAPRRWRTVKKGELGAQQGVINPLLIPLRARTRTTFYPHYLQEIIIINNPCVYYIDVPLRLTKNDVI